VEAPGSRAQHFKSEMAAALVLRMDLTRARAPFVPTSSGGLDQQCSVLLPLFPFLPDA
jgi:hypothetical protein